ncbi:MAG: hypothetical protein MZU95_01595 [Desulfomicrobium escambiense]|nr:hypothetical protein [Desulfomicrobium escambiense]
MRTISRPSASSRPSSRTEACSARRRRRTAPFKDLHTLAFRMALDFQLNRYRDIVRVGEACLRRALSSSPRPGQAELRPHPPASIGEAEPQARLPSTRPSGTYRMALEVDARRTSTSCSRPRALLRPPERRGQGRRGPPGRSTGWPARPRPTSEGAAVGKGAVVRIRVRPDGPAAERSGWNSRPASPGGRPLLSLFLVNGRVVWEGISGTPARSSFADRAPRPVRNSPRDRRRQRHPSVLDRHHSFRRDGMSDLTCPMTWLMATRPTGRLSYLSPRRKPMRRRCQGLWSRWGSALALILVLIPSVLDCAGARFEEAWSDSSTSRTARPRSRGRSSWSRT